MPSLTFVLPHWLYWSGLLLFPLLAMFIVHRERKHARPVRTNLPTAYLLLVIGGFIGLHRFYARSRWAWIFIPLFLAVLWGNVHTRDARFGLSTAHNEISVAEFQLKRAEDRGQADLLVQRKQEMAQAEQDLRAAQADHDRWQTTTRYLGVALLALIIIDALLLPRLVRRCCEREARAPLPPAPDWTRSQADLDRDPSVGMHTWITRPIDALSGFTGQFVALWSIIAVFVYYYEVLARYVFNSPTNWAHESMFLMFGMQYLIAGAYALREGSHVRVDVVYMHLPDRGKAVVDVITSLFFFIFTIALVWTGWIFALDSMQVNEVSFTEWAIQYWPIKLAIPIGAALLLLQGIAHLIKDILIVAGKGVPRGT